MAVLCTCTDMCMHLHTYVHTYIYILRYILCDMSDKMSDKLGFFFTKGALQCSENYFSTTKTYKLRTMVAVKK